MRPGIKFIKSGNNLYEVIYNEQFETVFIQAKVALLPDKNCPVFYNKSLHIIVGLCIIAIIVTSVWSANNPIEPESDKIISEQTQIENENQASAPTTDVE